MDQPGAQTTNSRPWIARWQDPGAGLWRAGLVALVLSAAAGPAPGQTGAGAGAEPPAAEHAALSRWRDFVVAADEDAAVREAHAVFRVLLRAWDSARVAPALYVVESAAGPWAASLADGNILLSRAAIEACRHYGAERAPHLLAFVLAHELAHQQANDLWHRRFFRLADRQDLARRARMLEGLELRPESVDGLQAREARADHDGLLMMASVGFDPHRVLQPRDFFTDWVENLWQAPCAETDAERASACRQARTRAVRARAQLETLATQASLYELGVQAYVGGNFERARRLFSAYGREHPGRLAFTALGLVDLGEARRIESTLADPGEPRFAHLLLLAEREPAPAPATRTAEHRGLSLRPTAEARQRLLESAIGHFEQAVRLAPEHDHAYLLLASAYLMADNAPMTRGVLQGRFEPRFGAAPAADLLLAMTLAIEGRAAAATAAFEALLEDAEGRRLRWRSSVSDALLAHALYHNAAVLAERRGGATEAAAVWRRLARSAREAGMGSLFQLALRRLQPGAGEHPGGPPRFPETGLARPGDVLPQPPPGASADVALWLDGEAYRLLRYGDGRRLLLDRSGRVDNAWRSGGQARLLNGLAIGDAAERPFKVLGVPDRHLFLQSGEYLCYDRLGLALHLVGQRLAGWLLLEPPP